MAGALRLLYAALLATGLTTTLCAPAFAARAGVASYASRPALATMLAMIVAGGGFKGYKTLTLIGVLAGPRAHTEVAELTRRYGAARIKDFITSFDFVVGDARRLMQRDRTAFPPTPQPDPTDGKALSAALYALGAPTPTRNHDVESGNHDVDSSSYDVDSMLDHLLSRPARVRITQDLDARYGPAADITYRSVLRALMQNLEQVYSRGTI